MSSKQDLLLRLDSEFNDKGFKSASDSARVLERELDKQENAERRLAALQMAAHREDQARQAQRLTSMANVGKGMTAVGLLAAAGLGMASKAAMDWESAWAGVTKTVDGSPEQMAALEKELRALATTLPATHEEIAGVAEAAGQLGVKRQDIAAFTKTMIDLGVSTNLSADEAATGIAQISNVMGTMAREGSAGISRFGATLVALGNDGASTERDILEMAARVSGAGKLIGASESDVLALSNAMSSLGIDAELGGGAMSRTMLKINSAVKEGGADLEKFARVSGVSAQVFAQKWQSDPVAAIDLFVKGLARVNAGGGDAAKTLSDVGLKGTQNAQVLLRMTGAGDLLTRSIELGNRAWEENSALVDEANKRYETTESRLKIARNELNDAAIDIGANVLPALASAADRVGFLAETFHSLPEPVKEAVTVLGGIVLTVGLLGGAFLILIPKLVAANATLAATGPAGARAAAGLSAVGRSLLGPWGLALTAATVALGIFVERQYEAKQRSQELTATLDQQTGAITAATKAAQAKTLQDQGMFDIARKAGVSLQLVTEAASGQADAIEQLRAAQQRAEVQAGAYVEKQAAGARTLGDVSEALDGAQGAFGVYSDAQAESSDKAGEQNAALLRLLATVDPMGEEVLGLSAAQREVAAATGEATGATEAGVGAAEDFSAAQASSAQSTEDARKELEDLVKAVEGYGDTVNAALDATSGYEAAIDDAAEALKKNGATANKARTAIDLHTEAGRANDKALREIASSALEAATANFQNGKSVKSVTGDVVKARAEFITMATKMGLSKKAAGDLANQLGLTKGNVSTLNDAIRATPPSKTVEVRVKTAEAKAAVERVQSWINGLHGKDVRINVRYNVGQLPNGGRDQTGGITSAQGNLFEFSGRFRGGGYAPIGMQQPQIRAAAGNGLTWAEQGAGPWEAFISGNPAKRDRSMAIWEDTGRRLGAFEAMRSQPAVMVEGTKTIDRSMHVTAYGHSADDVARAIRRDQAKQAALHPEFGG